jgi:prepilin-type N-terminal cleavage/methylation domain-containing protein
MRRSHSSGFTLVEILMVLAIMGIMTIVAMPSLMKSIRGNRLRVGTRTIVMAANYARTSAILRNQEMKLTLDKENNLVSVDPLRTVAPAIPGDQIFKSEDSVPVSEPAPDPDAPQEPQSAVPFSSITRKLDAVQIESFTVDGKKSGMKGEPAAIVYQSNGRCTPFEARVVDEFGSSMLVTVDAVGAIKVTQKGN